MLRTVLASVFTVALLASARAADDTYTLKLYESKKGDKIVHEKREEGTTTIDFIAGGMKKNLESPNGSKEKYTQEILEKKAGDKRPTKLTRTYTVAEKVEKGEPVKLAYADKTVLIEKKGDKFTFSIDGKELSDMEAGDLVRQFDKKDDEPQNQDLLPSEAIKVGGTWTVPADKSEKMFKSLGEKTMKLDLKKSKIEGKLVKVYKKDGAQYGVLELTITAFITEIELGGEFVKTADTSKMVMKGVIDTCIDGSVDFEDSTLEVNVTIAAELPGNSTITVDVKTKGTEKLRMVNK
jgi:hypothetical protein